MYRQNRIVKSPLLIIIKEAEARMFVHLKTKTIFSLLEGAIFAKALGNGYAISACIGKKDLLP